MRELGYGEKCRTVLASLETPSGDQIRDLANFERYLLFYTRFLESTGAVPAPDVASSADYFRRLSNFTKLRLDISEWAANLEAVRIAGAKRAPLILAELLATCYNDARWSPDLNRTDKEQILKDLGDLAQRLQDPVARDLLRLHGYYERASWSIIESEYRNGAWEALTKKHKTARDNVAQALRNHEVIRISEAVRASFFKPGGYTARRSRSYVQKLCSADLFGANRLVLHVELDSDFAVSAESPRNRIVARDIAHLLQCRRYETKQLVIGYYGNTLGNERDLLSKAEERMYSFK